MVVFLTTVVVGAPFDDDNGANSGSAYAFEETASGLNATRLLASDGVAGDFFGMSVAMNGDGLMIGATQANGAVRDSGQVYLYTDGGGGGGGGDGGGGDGGDPAPPVLTVTDAGVSPTEIRISPGERVQVVNNSSRVHQIQSNPHPIHTDCPPLNEPGRLEPGASGFTDVFTQAGNCGFHDHLDPVNASLQGLIVIEAEGAR